MEKKEIINYLVNNRNYLEKKDIKLFIHNLDYLNNLNVEKYDILECLKLINEKLAKNDNFITKKRLEEITKILNVVMKEDTSKIDLEKASYMIDSLYYDLDLPVRENNAVALVLVNKIKIKKENYDKYK